MANQPLYPNAKPDCDVLVLCEGDAVGYEAKLLKAWADANDLKGRFVRVMPCGTAEALYGMADAFGRTVPIIVIEDRDFRTRDEAIKECTKKSRNREGRNVAMRNWFAWQRAEIENYFIDDEVLPGVFADAFMCQPEDVRNAVRGALGLLWVAQSLEYALYRVRKNWLSTDANRALRVECVKWNNQGQATLSAADVKAKLEKRLSKWQTSLHDGTTWEDPMAGEQLLADFDAKCNQWANMDYGNPIWRTDWACKEVLKNARMALTQGKTGWWSSQKGVPLNWPAFADDKARDQHDRFIERGLQENLVNAVLDRLKTDLNFDLGRELDNLATLIRIA